MTYNPLYAGVDEVGRGCLAGPVTVCALILKSDILNDKLNDSKKLTAKQRDVLFDDIIAISSYKIFSYDVDVIDDLNILWTTMKGMKETLESLNPMAAYIDGNRCPDTHIPCEAIIQGDDKVPAISAASIIAKVTRDRMMIDYAAIYPEYGFEKHKGYGTKQHLEALRKYGITSIHRKSFAPVRNILSQPELF